MTYVREPHSHTQGSSLVSIIVISLVAVTVLTAMVALSVVVLLSISSWGRSSDSIVAAESTVDDMMIRILRNPSTTPAAGSFLGFPNATGYPFVTPGSGGNPHTLIVRGVSGNHTRVVKVRYTFDTDGKLVVISRQEE